MKNLLICIFCTISISVSSQEENIKLTKFTSTTGNPIIQHESESHLYVFHPHSKKIYSILKSDPTSESSYKLKYATDQKDINSCFFIGEKLISYKIDRERKGVNMRLSDANTGILIKEVFVKSDKFYDLSAVSVIASQNKSRLLIRMHGYLSRQDKEEYIYKAIEYIVDDNFEILHSQSANKNRLSENSSFDNDGTLYEIEDGNLVSYNANKDYEKWSQPLVFENQVSATGGRIYDLQIKSNDNHLVIFGLYKNNSYTDDGKLKRVYSSSYSSHIAILRVDEFSKEIISARLVPYITQFSSNTKISLLENGRFITSELDKESTLSGQHNFKTFNISSFSSSDQQLWRKTINNKHIYTKNLWETYDYNGYGIAINNENVSVFYNINSNNEISGSSGIINDDTSSTTNIDKIINFDNSYKHKLKTANNMITIIQSFDITSGETVKSKFIFSKEDSKINKAWLVPSLFQISNDKKLVYVIGNKRLSFFSRFVGFIYGNQWLNRNQHIGVYKL